MDQNANQDYKVFGGLLLVWYWCLIIGGILALLTMVIPALLSIAVSFLIGIVYLVGILISIITVCISAAFYIKAAIQLKARNLQFFDTYVNGILITFAGAIASSLLTITSIAGIGNFIGSVVGSIFGLAIGLGLSIMYFSKSVRVNTYFGERPVQKSRYWNWIKLLPSFITSETMPDPNNLQNK